MLAVALRLGLAALLLVSSVAKAWDLPGTRQALAEFGVTAAQTRRASYILLFAEVFVAALLLSDPLTRLGAALASALFLTFAAGIANVLRQGRRPECHCLGQLHSAPVGPLVVVRNLLLMVASLVVAGQPVFPLTATTASQLATFLGAACVALAASHLCLWQSTRRQPQPYLGQGQLLPHLDVRSQDGQVHPIHSLLDTSPQTLLVFSSPTCSLCLPLLPELDRWSAMLSDKLRILLLDVTDEMGGHAWVNGSYQVGSEALILYKVPGTPSAILLDKLGRVVLPKPATGFDEILATIRAVLPASV